MCFFCLDQEYVSQRGSSHSNCPVKDKKQFWTCTGNGCRLHFWICDNKDHVNLNNFKFERTKRYWRGRGVTFGNFTAIFQINSPQTMEQITPENSQTTSPPTAQIQFKELRSLEDATESLKKTAKGTDIVEVRKEIHYSCSVTLLEKEILSMSFMIKDVHMSCSKKGFLKKNWMQLKQRKVL